MTCHPNRRPAGQLVNCKGCGRDTTNYSGFCTRCLTHGRTQIDDAPDRRYRPAVLCAPIIREDDYSADSNP